MPDQLLWAVVVLSIAGIAGFVALVLTDLLVEAVQFGKGVATLLGFSIFLVYVATVTR